MATMALERLERAGSACMRNRDAGLSPQPQKPRTLDRPPGADPAGNQSAVVDGPTHRPGNPPPTNGRGPVSWSTWTSRSWARSPTVVVGRSWSATTASRTTAATGPSGSATDTSIQLSTTAGWPTRRSSLTSERRLPSGPGNGQPPGSPRWGSPLKRCSRTFNGGNYRSKLFDQVLGEIKHRKTRPYRPQTNVKVELLQPHHARGVGLRPALRIRGSAGRSSRARPSDGQCRTLDGTVARSERRYALANRRGGSTMPDRGLATLALNRPQMDNGLVDEEAVPR